MNTSLRNNSFAVVMISVLMTSGIVLNKAHSLPAAHAPDNTKYVTYDAGYSKWLNAPKTVEMSQGVTFGQDDAVLKTAAAIVNLDDHQQALNAKSLSPVHLYDPQNDLTGQHGFIDFTRRIATLTDHIILVVKPAPHSEKSSGGSLRTRFNDPATISCDLMTYDYRKKTAHVPGHLTVHQKDRVVTADSAEYDSNGQLVTLVGNVRGRDSDGNIIQTSKLVMVIKEGAESITIPVPTHGKFRVKDEQEPPPAAAPPAPPLPAPKSSPKDTAAG